MDFTLTPEQEELRQLARTFAYEEVRPMAREYDQHRDPADCHPLPLFRRADELGLRKMALPREYGGLDVDLLTEIVVLEELCTGDTGFGMTLQHSWREGKALIRQTTESQRERYLDDFLTNPLYFTARATAEPGVGSDTSSFYIGDLQAGPQTSAVRDGDEWILNGTKRWITNGNIADMYMIVTRTDKTVTWNKGCTVFLIPKGTPGLTPGKAENKIGIRCNQNAEIILEDCRVPHDDMLGELNAGHDAMRAMGGGSKAKTAAKSLGIARAAYEELVAMVNAAPGPVEQSLDEALARMAAEIEAARALMWHAGWALQNRRPEGSDLERMAFVKSSEVCAQVSSMLIEIHMPEGLLRGSLAEKLVRDAATMLHAGGGKHAVRARVGAGAHQ